MKDQEFDKKIREDFQRSESMIIKPQWNKKRVWNRIEAELDKKNSSSWWKAAAAVLFLISATWTFAQWNSFQNYKRDKEIEVSSLQKQLDNSINGKKEMTRINDLILSQKNHELDSLKNFIHRTEEISERKVLSRTFQSKNITSANHNSNSNKENLIDSLQNQLKLTKVMLVNLQEERMSRDTTPKSGNSVISRPVPPGKNILFINNQNRTSKNRQGLKFQFLGNSKNDNVEYKSDHSIFKK